MKKQLTALLTGAAMAGTLLTGAVPAAAADFSDVSADSWYAEAVTWGSDSGVVTGYDGNLFKPTDNCSRAQIISFIWRAAGSPELNSTYKQFSDVSSSDYYFNAVKWGTQMGIVSGTSDTNFSPNKECTRAEAVTMLGRARGAAGFTQEAAETSFSDVPSTAYYASAVKWATDEGITSGFGNGIFAPKNKCKRSEIVSFLYRMMVDSSDKEKTAGTVGLTISDDVTDANGNSTKHESITLTADGQTITTGTLYVKPGTEVTVTCKPDTGYSTQYVGFGTGNMTSLINTTRAADGTLTGTFKSIGDASVYAWSVLSNSYRVTVDVGSVITNFTTSQTAKNITESNMPNVAGQSTGDKQRELTFAADEANTLTVTAANATTVNIFMGQDAVQTSLNFEKGSDGTWTLTLNPSDVKEFGDYYIFAQ